MLLYNTLAIFSESVLSIYPIIIKLTTLDVPFNTFVRLTSYLIISSIFANYEILSAIGLDKLLALAGVNIAHILSSYYGFKALIPSMAQSIFYIYPFINLLFNIYFFGEAINKSKFLFLIPIIYSIYNIYGIGISEGSVAEKDINFGLTMIGISAITESLLYILIKSIDLGNNPWNPLLVSYGLAAILYGIYYIYTNGLEKIKNTILENKKETIELALANMAIGSLGYGLRFWSIPRVQSISYSIISYTGIFTSIAYSILLGIEKFSIYKIGYLLLLAMGLIGIKLL